MSKQEKAILKNARATAARSIARKLIMAERKKNANQSSSAELAAAQISNRLQKPVFDLFDTGFFMPHDLTH